MNSIETIQSNLDGEIETDGQIEKLLTIKLYRRQDRVKMVFEICIHSKSFLGEENSNC